MLGLIKKNYKSQKDIIRIIDNAIKKNKNVKIIQT